MRSERNQGRAPTWAGSTTRASASTIASTTSRRRWASRRSRGWTSCSSGGGRSLAPTRSDCRGSRASRHRSTGRGEERRSWFVYPLRLAEGVDRDATIARLAERGVAGQGLPALHPPLPAPARAGLPGGPVPGRRSRRPPARSRFPSSAPMTESQVERGMRGSRPRDQLRADVSLPQRPRPALLAAEPLDRVRLAAGAVRHRPVPGACAWALRDRRARRGRARADDATASSGFARRWRSTASSSRRPTRTSTWPSSACSARRSGPLPESSTQGAPATTRWRPTSRWSSRPILCARSSSPARRWRACSSLPSPTATGRCPATPICSGRSPSTSGTICSPTSGCSPATYCASSSRWTAPASCRSAPAPSRVSTGRSIAGRSPPTWASSMSPTTRSTARPIATSSSTTWPRRPPARRTSRASARRS